MKKSLMTLNVLALAGALAISPEIYAFGNSCSAQDRWTCVLGPPTPTSISAAFVPAPVGPVQAPALLPDPDLLNIDPPQGERDA